MGRSAQGAPRSRRRRRPAPSASMSRARAGSPSARPSASAAVTASRPYPTAPAKCAIDGATDGGKKSKALAIRAPRAGEDLGRLCLSRPLEVDHALGAPVSQLRLCCDEGWCGDGCTRRCCPTCGADGVECGGHGACRGDGTCACAEGWGGPAAARCSALRTPPRSIRRRNVSTTASSRSSTASARWHASLGGAAGLLPPRVPSWRLFDL